MRRAGYYNFSMENERKSSIQNRTFCRRVSVVNRAQFVTDRVSYIVVRGRWCDVIVLNVHARTQEKSDYSKDRFYEKLKQVFNHFPQYHMKILLGDFKAKVRRENIRIFKPTIRMRIYIRIATIRGLEY
jgi:hypothetical protein